VTFVPDSDAVVWCD